MSSPGLALTPTVSLKAALTPTLSLQKWRAREKKQRRLASPLYLTKWPWLT